MNKENHNCDILICYHNNTKGLCCLYNPDNCKYRQLQKENAELKEKYDTCLRENTGLKIHNAYVEKKLTKAKDLLKQWLQTSKASGCDNINIVTDTEQFLNSEVDK